MDEVFGYFPPTANPPAKTPDAHFAQAGASRTAWEWCWQRKTQSTLITRALERGHTWFIGRLQTDRDKARVLDGLEGASSAAGARSARKSTV